VPTELGVYAAGVFALAGVAITSISQILVQRFQQKWTLDSEKRKEFARKRLGALQGAVQLCDFLSAAKGHSLGEGGREDWLRIRRENLANGALMPEAIQKDFQATITKVLLHDDLLAVEAAIDAASLERLRISCVASLQKEFGS
jgi:hypothetical protein